MGKDDIYTTDRKEEFRKIGRDGQIETFYRIWATSRSGAYYHIEISEAQLAQAPQLLAARAKQLDSI